ncbi:hypothetical protein [Streptomyces sp. NRRL S-1868]|nr:hypothetical protein [Streptomyces sp. NRRL S-1868]
MKHDERRTTHDAKGRRNANGRKGAKGSQRTERTERTEVPTAEAGS